MTDEQLKTIRILYCSGTKKEDTEKIQNTAGLEKLIELTQLELLSNKIVNIDISKNTKLINLDLRFNNLSSIDVTKNLDLEILNIDINQFTTVDVSKNLLLRVLYASNNNLTSLDVSKNLALEVTLNLVDTKEEYVPSNNSSLEKSEIVKVPDTGTGKSLLIGIVASMCLFAGIGIFYIQLGQKRN